MFPPETRVLIVDDMAASRALISGILRGLGFSSIQEANRAEEAWETLLSCRDKGEPIGLVFSDWNMPGMSGLELLRKVRAEASFRKLAFVLVSAESESARVLEAIHAGVSQYLFKPFTQDGVREKLQRAWAQVKVEAPAGPAGGAKGPAERQDVERELRQALARVLTTSFGTTARETDRFTRGTKPVPEANVAAGVSFSAAGAPGGPGLQGTAILAFEEGCFLALMSRYIGKTETEQNHETRDGAREILNMMMGLTKAALNSDSFEVKAAIPAGVTGKQVRSLASMDGRSTFYVYETDAGTLYLELLIEAKG